MSRNVSAARAHSAIKSHIPTMHQPTLWWRKISIIRVSSCWRWRGDWGAGRRWGGVGWIATWQLASFQHGDSLKKRCYPAPHANPLPPTSATPNNHYLPSNLCSAPCEHCGEHHQRSQRFGSTLGEKQSAPFSVRGASLLIQTGAAGKKHWVKDDDVHAGKKGSAVRVVEGGGGLAMRATTYMCRLHERRHKKRYNTQQKKNTTKDTRRLRWRKHRTVLGPTVMAAGTKLYSLRLSSPD